jgi:hypothetical protein
MPELMEEVVAFIERRTAELNEREDGAASRPTESVVPAALLCLIGPAPARRGDGSALLLPAMIRAGGGCREGRSL